MHAPPPQSALSTQWPPPFGSGWQKPPRQASPVPHSRLVAQARSQSAVTAPGPEAALSLLNWQAGVVGGKGWQTPEVQHSVGLQSVFTRHAAAPPVPVVPAWPVVPGLAGGCRPGPWCRAWPVVPAWPGGAGLAGDASPSRWSPRSRSCRRARPRRCRRRPSPRCRPWGCRRRCHRCCPRRCQSEGARRRAGDVGAALAAARRTASNRRGSTACAADAGASPPCPEFAPPPP